MKQSTRKYWLRLKKGVEQGKDRRKANACKKKDVTIVANKEIIRLFYEGLSIDMLAGRVALSENTGKRKAKDKVVNVIYDHQMLSKKQSRSTNM